MDRTEYLSEKELARRWGLSHRTLERWRHDAEGPAYLRLGGRIVYRVDDIEAYEVASQRKRAMRIVASSASVAPPVLTDKFMVPVDQNGLVDWFVDASPGDRLVYYRGHLAHDRMQDVVLGGRERADLNAVAHHVMRLAAERLVIPVQKRLGREDFLYIAVKARPGRTAVARRVDAPPVLVSASEASRVPIPFAA